MSRACQIARGHDPEDEFIAEICTWIKRLADASPDIIRTLDTIHRLSVDVWDAARDLEAGKTGAAKRLDTALSAHFDFGRGTHFNSVTAFCDSLWRSLDESRDADMARSLQAGAAIHDALSKLDKIGRHVRLVSINASVEASRAGDAGKGLSVIAVEFKALSEDIQKLAAHAKQEIDGLV